MPEATIKFQLESDSASSGNNALPGTPQTLELQRQLMRSALIQDPWEQILTCAFFKPAKHLTVVQMHRRWHQISQLPERMLLHGARTGLLWQCYLNEFHEDMRWKEVVCWRSPKWDVYACRGQWTDRHTDKFHQRNANARRAHILNNKQVLLLYAYVAWLLFLLESNCNCGALRKGPPFHRSRSSREINKQNASCPMGAREVAGRWNCFFVRKNEWSRSYTMTHQHFSLPWHFTTHGFLDPFVFPGTAFSLHVRKTLTTHSKSLCPLRLVLPDMASGTFVLSL